MKVTRPQPLSVLLKVAAVQRVSVAEHKATIEMKLKEAGFRPSHQKFESSIDEFSFYADSKEFWAFMEEFAAEIEAKSEWFLIEIRVAMDVRTK